MPTVVIQDVPDDVYESLLEQVEVDQRSVGGELLTLAEKALKRGEHPRPRLSEFVPSEEIPAPFDLPRSSQPVTVTAYAGEPRLPDAVFVERE